MTDASTDHLTISSADIEGLAGRLDGASFLTDHDRAVLASVFVLAGQAVAENEPEVAGFLNFTRGAADGSVRVANGMLLPAVRTGGLAGGFNFGLHNRPMDKVAGH